MIKLLRVDYRLVHGQVAISWSRHIGADCILVANDEVAKDEMRQSMLRRVKRELLNISQRLETLLVRVQQYISLKHRQKSQKKNLILSSRKYRKSKMDMSIIRDMFQMIQRKL